MAHAHHPPHPQPAPTQPPPAPAAEDRYAQFHAFRARLNERILGPSGGTLVTKRFFTLDTQTYQPGALDVKTKELLGLVASAVLRCDDCVAYHIDQCIKEGCSDQELWEALDIALIVGGSIVIPHLRRAIDFLDQARLHDRARLAGPPA
ncbi:MAG: carboxymuconolactone decarboxylase family protein [Planctomyces sp.]|nr:carboxymuconolactone decarboxylase family protein [Planctomyces sp.]MBA4120850.1 carboxymuconolactone decarboxylase family protein [Isosphaera sp.]